MFCDLFLVSKAAWLRAVDSTSYFAGVVPHQCGWSHQLSDMICLALVRVVYFLFVRTVFCLSARFCCLLEGRSVSPLFHRRPVGCVIFFPDALGWLLSFRRPLGSAIVSLTAHRLCYFPVEGRSVSLLSFRRVLGFAIVRPQAARAA